MQNATYNYSWTVNKINFYLRRLSSLGGRRQGQIRRNVVRHQYRQNQYDDWHKISVQVLQHFVYEIGAETLIPDSRQC